MALSACENMMVISDANVIFEPNTTCCFGYLESQTDTSSIMWCWSKLATTRSSIAYTTTVADMVLDVVLCSLTTF